MPVLYGDRTSAKGYDQSTMGGAVAAFLLARKQHWLFHMPSALTTETAKLVLSDFGNPKGQMRESKPGVWVREFEKATVSLDCASFTPSFALKSDEERRLKADVNES